MTRKTAFLFAATIVLFVGTVFAVVFTHIETAPAQPPDFYNDQWAAECNSSTAYQTVEKHRRHQLAYSCESFTGGHTFWRIYTGRDEEEPVTLHYQLTVESGLADLVLVRPDGTVTRLSGENSPYTFTPQKGESRVKLIGDEGKLSLELTIREMRGQWMDH